MMTLNFKTLIFKTLKRLKENKRVARWDQKISSNNIKLTR